MEAAPQLEDLREEAAESALHPDLVHLENLGSTEANAGPNLLVSNYTQIPCLMSVLESSSLCDSNGHSRISYPAVKDMDAIYCAVLTEAMFTLPACNSRDTL